MLTEKASTHGIGWRTAYELQVFRNGKWTINEVFDDRTTALVQARRLDRVGKTFRLREESRHASGEGQATRTIYVSTTIKNLWQEEQKRMAGSSRGAAHGGGHRVYLPHGRSTNPYYLLGMFSLVTFMGIAAIFALRTLYASI